ncbi:MAG: restriction endonuclease [Candidatus Tectomicrobia bacterium]|uniref:Restriction endonuclease n=1 Tax=Tectimicrobiota bacterium TaxID=2528274 RepID=A0A932HYX8_UNCTE|nr:restriction endonuclease [Candidatus Tectomicrobia bacterium]
MLELIAFALILGFVLIIFVRRTTSNVALEADAERARGDEEIQVLRRMPGRAFESMLRELVESLGLRIVEVRWVNDEEIDILANNPAPVIGGEYIVHGILVPEGDFVSSIRVIGLSDTVRAERALKGILITTGYFTEEVQKYAEGAPMELINVSRLREILKENGILWPAA